MGLWDKYSKDADSNNFPVALGGAPENWHGADVNNWGRAVMAELRLLADRLEWNFPLGDLDTARVTAGSGTTFVLARESDTRFSVASLSVAEYGIAAAYFVVGRRCKVIGSPNVECTISGFTGASTSLVDVEAIDGNGGVLPSTITDVAVYNHDPNESNVNSMLPFSGSGSTVDRDARFSAFTSVSDMLLWYNTTTDRLEISSGGAWVSATEAVLLAASDDPASGAEQFIEGDLTSNAGSFTATAGSFTATAGSFIAPTFTVVASALSRAKVTHDATDLIFSLYDTDEVTEQSAFKMGADGTFKISTAGGAFTSVLGNRVFHQKTANVTVSTAWVVADPELKNLTIPGANGARKFHVSVHITRTPNHHSSFDDTINPSVHTVSMGTAGTVGDATVLTLYSRDERKTTNFTIGAVGGYEYVTGGIDVIPGAADKITLGHAVSDTSYSLTEEDSVVYGEYGTSPAYHTWVKIEEVPV